MTQRTNTEPHDEESIILEPFIFVRVVEDEDATEVQCATLGEGDEKALLTFCTGEDAIRFREATSECTAEEGYYIVSDKVEGGARVVASVLEQTGLARVALAEPGAAGDKVNMFTAGEFLKMLGERTVTIESE